MNAFRLKYGILVAEDGFTQIPNILLRNRKRLKLTRTELELILFFMSHEYGSTTSNPSLRKIAKQSGASEATIHHARAGLENKGYLKVDRSMKNPRYGTYSYDLTGLRILLRKLAQLKLKDCLLWGKIKDAEYQKLKARDAMDQILFDPPQTKDPSSLVIKDK